MLQYKDLLIELTKREIKQRYKQSVLGYAWVMVNPLVQMLVMAFVFSFLLRFPDLETPYSIFLYAGLLPWTLFAASLQHSVNALVHNQELLTKIYFPREVFILSTILAKIVDFFLASIVFIGFMLFFQIPVGIHILWFPIIFIIQNIFAYGIALFISAGNLFYRDLQYIVNLGITIWMYLTPVIYPISMISERYHFWYSLNPMAAIIKLIQANNIT